MSTDGTKGMDPMSRRMLDLRNSLVKQIAELTPSEIKEKKPTHQEDIDSLYAIPEDKQIEHDVPNRKKKKEKKRKLIEPDELLKPIEEEKHEPTFKSPYFDQYLIPRPPFRLLICGPSTAGKTELIKNLLARPEFYKDYFTKVILISPNGNAAQWDPVHEAIGDKLEVHDIYSPEVEQELMLLYDANKELVTELGNDLAPKILVVYDDMVDDKLMKKSRFLSLLAVRGRHANFSVLFSTQFYNGFPLALRKQLSNIFCFSTANQKEIDAFTEELGHRRLTKKQFYSIYQDATKGDHSFLHCNFQCKNDRERYRRNFQTFYHIHGDPYQNPHDDQIHDIGGKEKE
jgi:hypothetical protein